MSAKTGRFPAVRAAASLSTFIPWSAVTGLMLAATLAGCAPMRLAEPPSLASQPSPPSSSRAAPVVGKGVSSLANLPGWREEDHLAAIAAVRAGCTVQISTPMQAVCGRLRDQVFSNDADARAFLEANFRPAILPGPGLLTAYYAPEYPARTAPDATFSAALRPKPADLVYPAPTAPAGNARPDALQLGDDGRTWPYPTRSGLELTPATDALAFLKPEDLFFLQIQGTGVLVFPDGRRMRASYAADNGRPFVALSGEMVRRGLLQPDHASATSIRLWLEAHRGPEAQAMMDLDPRYVFFNLTPDDGSQPSGAAGTPLPSGRAIAVDPTWHRYGEVFWIDARSPTLAGAVQRYQRLVVALDTGSAIRGDVRADLFMGTGEAAGAEAGRVRHALLLVRLEPLATPVPP